MMYGFTGKILHVDLTARRIEIETPDEAFYREWIGGSLMGLYYLWKFAPQGIDALSPDNVLTFALSATTGLPLSGQSRCTATCKSPTTGGVADSQAGGFWPAELKFAGYDAIVIRGASAEPLYLSIVNDQVELRPADHLWGKSTADVDAILKAEYHDSKIEIAQIGISGEKLSNFAAVMNMSNRAWGRTGIGAVMGSKKLKAIVVRGTNRVNVADKARVSALGKMAMPRMEPRGMEKFGRYGTAGAVMGQQLSGGLPTNNWDSGVMPSLESAQWMGGERLYDELLRGAEQGTQDKHGRDTCYACVVRCKRVVESEYKQHKLDPAYGGAEYEALAALGSYCGVNDLHALSYANQLCNEYGVDVVSVGATISWAMECFERGILNLEETDGIELRFGNTDALVAMLEKTLNREGFGDILADGSEKAAQRLGKGQEYLLTVKGQELPAHMPQVKRSLALIYAVNPFGADHQSSEHDPEYKPASYDYYRDRFEPLGLTQPQDVLSLNAEKINYLVTTQYTYSATDTMTLCQFVWGPSWQLYSAQEMAELLSATTGWDVTLADIQAMGQKRVNMMRAYNAREGLRRDQDTLPKKLFDVVLKGGKSDGIQLDREEFENGLDEYYAQVGWDQTSGIPTRATLEASGLSWLADTLHS